MVMAWTGNGDVIPWVGQECDESAVYAELLEGCFGYRFGFGDVIVYRVLR